jgi:HAD superfamily hydrolase (TIGR01509 family)
MSAPAASTAPVDGLALLSPSPGRRLSLLLWDIDGTVAETEHDGHRVAFNRAFGDAGLGWVWDEARYAQLLHVTGGRERLLADMATRPDALPDADVRERLARHLHAAKNRWYAQLVEDDQVQARPGVLALMHDAAANGVRQGIATTTSRANVEALMARLLGPTWAQSFSVVLCGEDTRRKKPDPEVYQLALARLGVPVDEALAIEDSTPGVRAARGAGLAVVLRPSRYFPPDFETAPDLLLVPEGAEFSWPSMEVWFRDRALGHRV